MRHCTVSLATCAAVVQTNANLSITDSTTSSEFLLQISKNALGKVELFRNNLSPSTDPVILLDVSSQKPDIDIKDAIFRGHDTTIRSQTTGKQRSKATKLVNDYIRQGASVTGAQHASTFDYLSKFGSSIKYCDKCGDVEQSVQAAQLEAEGVQLSSWKKFRFCKNCRAACYCSKECQVAHWSEHRLFCGETGGPKTTGGHKQADGK